MELETKSEEEKIEETKETVNQIIDKVSNVDKDVDTSKQEIKEEQIEPKEKTEKEENKENEERKYNNYGKHSEKSKKRIIIPIVIISFIVLILIALFCTVFALTNINSDKIIKGIYINNVDVSGLTKEEAKTKLEKVCNEKLQKEINIKYEEYESTINPTLIEANYEIDKAIEEAYNIGRNGNLFNNNFEILKCKMSEKSVNLNLTLNEEATINVINDISSNIPGYVKQSSYYIEDENLIITRGTPGISVNSEELLNLIYNNLSNTELKEEYITIPVINVDPEEIDIDKIHEEVYKEAQDAYYTKEPFTIYPEVDGVDFNLEEAKALLQEDKEEYTIKLIITKAQKTTKDIGTEAFPDLLSTFSTDYNASDTNRTTNLRLASNKINGTVLMPGEEFSYNKIVGERTIEAGYKEAAIFSGGQVVDGLGGGICQISSTLYNAVLFANLNVTVRRNHQFVPSYVSEGRDATVVWGSQDFKFVNSRKYPVRIVSSVSGGVATVSIYGIKEETEYEVSIETKRISTIAYGTVYKEDSSLAAGQEKVKQNGTNGKVVEAYKVLKLNGEVVSRTLLSKDTYNAKQRIVYRGTAATNNTQTQQTPNTTVTEKPVTTTPETPVTTTPQTPVETPSTTTEISTEQPSTSTGTTVTIETPSTVDGQVTVE